MKRLPLTPGFLKTGLMMMSMALPAFAARPAMFTGLAARSAALVPDSVASYETPHFLIVYSTRGPHAMASVDKNQDGVNDYLVSLGAAAERAWSLAIDSMGFKTPPLVADTTWYYKVPIPAGKLAIEVGDMGNFSPGFKGSPVLGYAVAPSKTPGKIAEILIENDFKYDSSGTSLPVLVYSPRKNPNGDSVLYNFSSAESIEKGWATAIAHEFFHCVEMSYENTYIYAFHEMSAAWFAMRAQPTVTYHWGTNQEFLTLLNGGVFQGDGQALFLRALAKYAGDGVIRQLWELRSRNVTQDFLYPEEQWMTRAADSVKLDLSGFFKYYASEVGCMLSNAVCDLNDNGSYSYELPTYRTMDAKITDTTYAYIANLCNPWGGGYYGLSGNAIHGVYQSYRIKNNDVSVASGYVLHLPSRKGEAFSLDHGAVVISANPEDEVVAVYGFSAQGAGIVGYPTKASASVGIIRRPNALPAGIQGRYDLKGRQVLEGRGLFIERSTDGSVRRMVGFGK